MSDARPRSEAPVVPSYDPSRDLIPVEQNDIIRLKIFIPLATMTALFSNLVCALLIKPSMGEINDSYYTLITPNKSMIGIYWMLIFACQIGMSFMVVCTSTERYRTEDTKQTFVNAVGMSYVVGLFGFAFWPIFWAAQLFLYSTIILFFVFLMMTYTLHSFWRYSPPTFRRKPFSYTLIYTPIHLFQLVLFSVDLPQSLFITLRWYRSPTGHGWESHHTAHAWIIAALVLVIGLVNALVIFRSKDIVRLLAVIYLSLAVLLKGRSEFGKLGDSGQVSVSLILVLVISTLSFLGSFIDFRGSERRIVLPYEGEDNRVESPQISS